MTRNSVMEVRRVLEIRRDTKPSPAGIELRGCFYYGCEEKPVVSDRWDGPGISQHLDFSCGNLCVATSRFTPVWCNPDTDCPETDILGNWTGIDLGPGRRLVTSRVVVRPDALPDGTSLRGLGLNTLHFIKAARAADEMGEDVNLACVVKSDLVEQVKRLERLGFNYQHIAYCEDIPGQKVPVLVLLMNVQQAKPLWLEAEANILERIRQRFEIAP